VRIAMHELHVSPGSLAFHGAASQSQPVNIKSRLWTSTPAQMSRDGHPGCSCSGIRT
jgi:hypothetical protein